MPTITRERLASAILPHDTQDIGVRETHLSYVLLAGAYAYKIKKAVALDFVDTTSLEHRRQLCEEELRLNRRYAPDLYLRVVPITQTAGKLHIDGTGEAVEYAVEMRRFESSEELQALLASNAVSETDLSALADCIADFHRRATVGSTHDAATCAFVRKARENLASVEARVDTLGTAADLDRARHWTELQLSKYLERLAARERDGFVRECHGDLHCGNVVRWKGALLPFDCIEFDPELRFIDVLNDVAFLAMDLIARTRRDLAFTLLNRYLERTGDYVGASLLPTYIVYRALVRVKVELIALAQHPEATDALERAHAYLRVARTFTQRQCSPILIIMNGASGSGKSWLSAQLVPMIAALRIRSDLERKRLAGIDPFDRSAASDPSIYTLDFNDRTYAHLVECARACLEAGVNAIVDAAFLKEKERAAFAALARSLGTPFLIVSCTADADTLAARIAERRAARNDPSDADERIMRRQLETMEVLTPDERTQAIEIDTRAVDAMARVVANVGSLTAAHT